jgi:hypothetical protein
LPVPRRFPLVLLFFLNSRRNSPHGDAASPIG